VNADVLEIEVIIFRVNPRRATMMSHSFRIYNEVKKPLYDVKIVMSFEASWLRDAPTV
jgi:hypothetical protein